MTIKTLRRILKRFPSNSIISIRNDDEDYDISHISFSVTNDNTYSLVLNCGAKDEVDK